MYTFPKRFCIFVKTNKSATKIIDYDATNNTVTMTVKATPLEVKQIKKLLHIFGKTTI